MKMSLPEKPDWADAAFEFLASREFRVTRWHLTDEQRDQLRRYTGQDQRLLGLPVAEKVKRHLIARI